MARLSVLAGALLIGALTGAVITNSHLQGEAPAPPAMVKELTSYRDIVKRVLPAVVSVESRPTNKAVARKDNNKATPRRRQRMDAFPGLPEEFRRFLEDQMDDGAELPDNAPRFSFGSGFIIDPKGVVLTNYHVVEGVDRVKITLKDGRSFLSTEIKGDRKNDLAIVHIKGESPLPYIEMGDSDAMEIGDRVLAVGAPFGLTGSVTSGIVSAKSRGHMTPGESVVYEDYLQTDAAINPGNSGGPLVNLDGKVIGINTMIRSRSGGFQGVGLAITSNVAKNIADQLLKDGVVHRGYLGVKVQEVRPEIAEDLGVKERGGVLVSQVVAGGPASKAGIKEGDVITSLNGKPIPDGRELQRLVAGLPLKKPVDIQVLRDGKPQALHVTIQEQPDISETTRVAQTSPRGSQGELDEVKADSVGLTFADVTPEVAQSLGFAEEMKGAVITAVERGGVAAEAGLGRGMVLTRVGRQSVSSAVSARDLLQKADLAKGVLVQIHFPPRQGGGSTYVKLKAETADK